MKILTQDDMLQFVEFLIEEYDLPINSVQMGLFDNMDDYSVGVRITTPNQNNLSYGNVSNTKIRNLNVSYYLHGSKKSRETEMVANQLFETIEYYKNGFYCDDIPIVMLVLQYDKPYPLGPDKDGVFEYIINFSIKYRCD
jgi:hypothetical protein